MPSIMEDASFQDELLVFLEAHSGNLTINDFSPTAPD